MTTNSDLGGSDLYDLTIHVSDVPLNDVECHDELDILYEALADPLYILRIVDRLGNAEKRDREV